MRTLGELPHDSAPQGGLGWPTGRCPDQPQCPARFGDGSDCVGTLAGRRHDALLHSETITDKALRQASVAKRPGLRCGVVSPGLCARIRLGEAAAAPMPIAREETFDQSRRREGTSSSGQACPDGRKEKTNVKGPKWLRWESSETKSDHLKKVRQQTDQRMKQQEAQKEREKNQSPSIGSAI